MAQEWASPAATCVQLASLPTRWGANECVPLASGSTWPAPLLPQHHKLPSTCTPQVCCPPAATLCHAASPTRVGMSRWPLPPTPSCPLSLLPQHHNDPSSRIPQLWFAPALTCTQVGGSYTKVKRCS